MSIGYRLYALIMVVAGILCAAAGTIYSILEFSKLDLYDPVLRVLASVGILMILAGILLRVVGDRRQQTRKEESEGPKATMETILLSYAMVNKEPRKNVKDLQLYLLSEGLADLSLKELKVMVDKALMNIRMDMIKPSLKAKLFTEDGKLRKYQFASDFCPRCGVFKNYHKECKFCGYHEMSS